MKGGADEAGGTDIRRKEVKYIESAGWKAAQDRVPSQTGVHAGTRMARRAAKYQGARGGGPAFWYGGRELLPQENFGQEGGDEEPRVACACCGSRGEGRQGHEVPAADKKRAPTGSASHCNPSWRRAGPFSPGPGALLGVFRV